MRKWPNVLCETAFFDFWKQKKIKKTKKCIFSDIEKWPNVLCETAIFSKKSTKKGSGGGVLRAPKNPILCPFWDPKSALLRSFLRSFFGACFGPLLDHFWAPFWGPFWQMRGPKMTPKMTRKKSLGTGQDSPKSGSSGPVSSQVVHTQSHMYAKKPSNVKPPRYLKVSLSAI